MAVNEMEAPELPSGEIAVEKPPSQVEAGGMGSILATAIPMMGSMGVMVIMALTQGQNTRMLLMAGGMVFMMLSMVGFNIYRQVSQYRNKVNSQRREYLSYLSETRTSVRNIAAKQRIFMQWYLPEPDSLVLLAEKARACGNAKWATILPSPPESERLTRNWPCAWSNPIFPRWPTPMSSAIRRCVVS